VKVRPEVVPLHVGEEIAHYERITQRSLERRMAERSSSSYHCSDALANRP
jgi:hypothetical protein